MILSCIILDDEPLAVELIESYVRKTPFLSLEGGFTDPVEAFQAIQEQAPDILFCDIQMPSLNGMELSRMLPEHTRIIFITAFSQYAAEGFRVNAIDYLLKPVSYEDFLVAAKKALEWFGMKEKAEIAANVKVGVHANGGPDDMDTGSGERSLDTSQATGAVNEKRERAFVKSGNRLIQVEFNDITYIEGMKDYVRIHLESAPGEPVVSLMSMKAVMDMLPEDRFMRVHRSFIVSLPKVRVIERNCIIFGETFIPVAENLRDTLLSRLNL